MTPAAELKVHRAAIVACLQEESGITLPEASVVLAHFDQAVVVAVQYGYDRAHAQAIACACNGTVGGAG